jgi:hypothetical protein
MIEATGNDPPDEQPADEPVPPESTEIIEKGGGDSTEGEE